jgi:hypothetical protein
MSAVPSVGVPRSRYMSAPPLIGRVSEHQDELKGALDDSPLTFPERRSGDESWCSQALVAVLALLSPVHFASYSRAAHLENLLLRRAVVRRHHRSDNEQIVWRGWPLSHACHRIFSLFDSGVAPRS